MEKKCGFYAFHTSSNSQGVYCVGVFNGQERKIKHKSRNLKIKKKKSQNNNEKQIAIGSDEQQQGQLFERKIENV